MKSRIVQTIGKYTIERGVSMPAMHGDKVAVILSMDIGDSVVLSRVEANWWTGLARKYGVFLATRKISETHSRCWRIAEKPRSGRPGCDFSNPTTMKGKKK